MIQDTRYYRLHARGNRNHGSLPLAVTWRASSARLIEITATNLVSRPKDWPPAVSERQGELLGLGQPTCTLQVHVEQ